MIHDTVCAPVSASASTPPAKVSQQLLAQCTGESPPTDRIYHKELATASPKPEEKDPLTTLRGVELLLYRLDHQKRGSLNKEQTTLQEKERAAAEQCKLREAGQQKRKAEQELREAPARAQAAAEQKRIAERQKEEEEAVLALDEGDP